LGRRDFNYLELSYFYDRLLYADHNEFDANQHHIATGLKVQRRRLTLDGSDTIDFLSSPIGGGYSASFGDRGEGITSVGGAKIDRSTFFDRYRLTWDASDRTDLYLQATHFFLNYQKDLPLYDSRSISGTLGFEYHPFVKTFFFGETYYGQTENKENAPGLVPYPTANFVGFFVGARGQFTERLKGTAKAGYEHRYYSDDGPTVDVPVVDITLDHQFSERTLLSATYSRRQYESIQFTRSPYTTDSISFSWMQQIGGDGRLRSVARAGYWLSSFETTTQSSNERSDQFLNASLTISYDIKLWVRAFGSYNFEHLTSNEPSIVDYNVNRVTLGLQIGY
jgi:hypothetical protein